MYCKDCGAELEEASNFCSKCGNKINSETENHKPPGCLTILFKMILIILAILGVVYLFDLFDSSKSNKITTREATNSDIIVDSEINVSKLGVDIIIQPKCDIDNLIIEINQYDKNGYFVRTFTKNLGDVIEYEEYNITISLTDFSASQILNLGKTEIKVIDGRVSNFDK